MPAFRARCHNGAQMIEQVHLLGHLFFAWGQYLPPSDRKSL